MAFPQVFLFVLIASVFGSHISHVSPLLSAACSPCNANSETFCQSTRPTAPLINLASNSGCQGNCVDWATIVPQSVEDVDSAFAWDVITPYGISVASKTNYLCGTGYYLFGVTSSCSSGVKSGLFTQLLCKRATNLPIQWGGGGNAIQVTSNPWGSSGSFNCPAGTYLVGFGTGNQLKFNGISLWCAYPPDIVCPSPDDQNTTFVAASGCTTSIHQYCVVTLACKPFFQPQSGSVAAECRPAATLAGVYNTSTLRCVDIDECVNRTYCGPNTLCTNVIGAAPLCSCLPGYRSGPGGCVNVDECQSACLPGEPNPIAQECNNCPTGTCVDSIGNFSCVQPTDPCTVRCNATVSTNCNNCSSIAINCTSNFPAYTCTCPSGYSTTDGGKTCVDIDECLTFPCPLATSTCQNLNGSFTCNCLLGYAKVNSTCQPINECLAFPCPNSTQCVDTTPLYYCVPQIIQVSKGPLSSPFTLASTQQTPADVVTFTIRKESFCTRSSFLFYGSSNQFQTSPCTKTNITANTYDLNCGMLPGAGANLSFSLQCCPNSTFPIVQSCVLIPAPSFLFSYPRPTLTSPTLTYPGNAVFGTVSLDASQSGVVLTMQGTNFLPSATAVFFGTSFFPLAYTCDVQSMNFTSLTCTPQVVIEKNLSFTVVVGDGVSAQQSALGLDLLSIVGDPPVVYDMSGCDKNGIGVKNCPTEGGVELIIIAKTASNLSLTAPYLLIGGNPCVRTGVLSAQGFHCTLPPGSGENVAVELRDLTGSWFDKIVSYAPPRISRISSSSCANSSPLILVNCSSSIALTIEGDNFGPSKAVVMLGSVAVPVIHVPFLRSAIANGKHHFLVANVSNVPQAFNPVAVTQFNGGWSVEAASFSLAPCDRGYGRIANVCTQCDVGRYWYAEACLLCKEGFYQSLMGKTTCMPCPSGTIQPATGQINCTRCGVGSFPNAGHSACESCSPGKFNAVNQSSACVDCLAGFYQPDPAASACLACPPGTYSTSNAIACENCPPGRVSQANGTGVCIRCPPGTFQSAAGQILCQDCDKGFYNPVPSSPFCLQCLIGTYQNDTRQTTCTKCALGSAQSQLRAIACDSCIPGTISPTLGLSSCQNCPPGRFANASGGSECELCDVGTAQQAPGALQCESCAAGYYSNTVGLDHCIACGPGYFQNSSGTSRCDLCVAGQYTNSRASLRCVDCEPGKFQPGQGQQRCSACAPGLYQPNEAQTACAGCAPGAASVSESSTLCATCPPATFSLSSAHLCSPCGVGAIQPLGNQSSCESCPFGSYPNEVGTRCLCAPGFYSTRVGSQLVCTLCPPGSGDCSGSGQTFDRITTLQGFWRSANATSFYRCHIPTFCLGQDTCQAFREGPMCALCMDGYKSSGPGSACVACPATLAASWGITLSIILALALLLVLLYYIALRVANAQQARLFTIVELNNKLSKDKLVAHMRATEAEERPTETQETPAPEETMSDFEAPTVRETDEEDLTKSQLKLTIADTSRRAPNFMYKVKILVGFFQIASYLPSQGDIAWPAAFVEFIGAFSLFNFDFIPWQSLGCAVQLTYFQKSAIVGLVPVGATLLLILFFGIGIMLPDMSTLEEQMEKGQKRAAYWLQFVRLQLFTVFLLYPLVSKSAFGLFNCVTVEGVSYLVVDFELLCYNDSWNSYAALNGFFVVLYPIGIPFLYFLVLRRSLSRMREPETILSLGFLFEAYSEEAWFWELVDMSHKLILTSVVVFAPNSQRMPWNMVIIGAYLIALLIVQPYVRKGDDRFHQHVQITLFSITTVGLILREDKPYDNSLVNPVVMERLVAALLIIMVLVLIISFVIIAGRNVQKIVRARKKAKELAIDILQPAVFSPFVIPSTSNSSKSNSKNSRDKEKDPSKKDSNEKDVSQTQPSAGTKQSSVHVQSANAKEKEVSQNQSSATKQSSIYVQSMNSNASV